MPKLEPGCTPNDPNKYGIDTKRGDTRNHLKKDGIIYKPGSEIEFEDRRLKILGRLGKGAFGTAFLVMDWETRELFTLKSFSGLSSHERKDIQRAIKTLKENELPEGTVQEFVSNDLSKDDLLLYTYITGHDLNRVFQEQGVYNLEGQGIGSAITYTSRLIANWGVLSKHGLAHRDISLNNAMPTGVLIDPDCIGPIKELNGRPPINQTWFLAPEACEGKIHQTTDLHSIGIIGATFLLGAVPKEENAKLYVPGMRGWEPEGKNMREKLLGKRAEKGFKGTGYWEVIKGAADWEVTSGKYEETRRFISMLSRMLEFNPEDRPQTAEGCLDLMKE